MNSVGFGSNFSETYGFVTVKGDKRYLNISAMHSEDQNGDTTPINWKQLREQGDKKKFLAAIPYYSIVKYEVKGDKLHLWHQDPDFVQDAIAKKQIAGEEGRITAESKKVLEFITENDAKVFAEEMVFTRVK